MTNPYPSRRSTQKAEPHAPAAAASSSPSGGEADGGMATRSHKHHLKQARRFGWWVAAAGTVLFLVLLAAGARLSLSSKMEVKSVPGVLDMIEVSGQHGRPPVVLVTSHIDLASPKVRTEIAGTGRELAADEPVVLSITAFDGDTGQPLNEGGDPNIVVANLSSEELGETLTDLLIGRTEGSRLVVARPLDDGGTEVDVVDVLSTTASGAACESDPPTFLTIAVDGAAVTATPNGEAPSDLLVECILQGDGPQIRPEDDVVIQYLLGAWSDGSALAPAFANTMPTTIGLEEAMPGLENALIDQRVGTRLAVAIPPDMATGEDTMFAVVDVLAVIRPNATE